jgi:hypothetical protein
MSHTLRPAARFAAGIRPSLTKIEKRDADADVLGGLDPVQAARGQVLGKGAGACHRHPCSDIGWRPRFVGRLCLLLGQGDEPESVGTIGYRELRRQQFDCLDDLVALSSVPGRRQSAVSPPVPVSRMWATSACSEGTSRPSAAAGGNTT